MFLHKKKIITYKTLIASYANTIFSAVASSLHGTKLYQTLEVHVSNTFALLGVLSAADTGNLTAQNSCREVAHCGFLLRPSP